MMAFAVMQNELVNLRWISQFVKEVGHIAAAAGFNQQPLVLNGRSSYLRKCLGTLVVTRVWLLVFQTSDECTDFARACCPN